MHEVETIRAFRNDVMEPDEETFLHARRKLVKVIDETARVPRRGPYQRWLAVAGVAAVIAAVVLLPTVGRDRPQSLASASEALNRAAANIERGSGALWPGPGEYLYVRTKSAFLNSAPEDPGWSVMLPETGEFWTATDGSGRWLIVSGDPFWPSERDRARWEAAGSPELGGNHRSDQDIAPLKRNEPFASFGSGSLTLEEFLSLPTEPDELYARIEQGGRTTDNPVSYQMFVIIGDLLRTELVSPDLRAALYRVAADIPGIRLVGNVVDPVGRKGVAVTIDQTSATPGVEDPGVQHELIFDPDTGAFLAEREVMTKPWDYVGAEPGTVIGYRAILETRVVDSTGSK
jgi:hypothetical protein